MNRTLTDNELEHMRIKRHNIYATVVVGKYIDIVFICFSSARKNDTVPKHSRFWHRFQFGIFK